MSCEFIVATQTAKVVGPHSYFGGHTLRTDLA